MRGILISLLLLPLVSTCWFRGGPPKADEITLFGGNWPEGKTFKKTTLP